MADMREWRAQPSDVMAGNSSDVRRDRQWTAQISDVVCGNEADRRDLGQRALLSDVTVATSSALTCERWQRAQLSDLRVEGARGRCQTLEAAAILAVSHGAAMSLDVRH